MGYELISVIILHMNKKYAFIIILIIFVLSFFYVLKDKKGSPQDSYDQQVLPEDSSVVEETVVVDNLKDNQKKVMQATLSTNKGDIVIEFHESDAPKTVENFKKLASENFYNGVKFHRVIKGFMIQGGDPLTKDDSQMALWGTGGPGYKFNDEISSNNKNVSGTISMANAGPNTNGSQFFINTADNNFLDSKHTVFGHVVSGMDTVKAIESVPTNSSDRPVEPVIINSIVFK